MAYPERHAAPSAGQATMKAVVTLGQGGYEQLMYTDVPMPVPEPGEVLLQVLATSVNNTDINTRLGWYSGVVTTSTRDAASSSAEIKPVSGGGWRHSTVFPLIQGTDCCGRVVALAAGVDARLQGQRVLVRPSMRPAGFAAMDNLWLGSDFDGAFAQYLKVPASDVFVVNSHWSDAELASMPCAYGTAENMLHRAKLSQGEHVVITGASGGVGSAAVQLAKRRGAKVSAIVGRAKMAQVAALGADHVLAREDDLLAYLGENTVDMVVDNVVGPAFGTLLKLLKPGGRYVSSGAIAGPLVTLDLRTMYLKNLTLLGCTAWEEPVFANLVAYIERDEIKPLVAQTFALAQIVQAQQAFMEKTYVGKLVLIPPVPGQG